jgi:hypothetical protein
MDHYFEPEFDFSELDEDELWRLGGVTHAELESVIRNGSTIARNALICHCTNTFTMSSGLAHDIDALQYL